MRRVIPSAALALAAFAGTALGQPGHARRPARRADSERGILNQPAPSWAVTRWLNLPEGRTALDIRDYRGRVVYLYGFQSWCPGCHSYGFPTLQELIGDFEQEADVAFVAVQTVFEGFPYNTFDHAKKIARRYQLTIPVGQSGENGRRSELMKRYRTGGTPWTILIDRQGIVRFNDFRITRGEAGRLIRELLAEAPPAGTPATPSQAGGQSRAIAPGPGDAAVLPLSRAGHDLLGKSVDLQDLQWISKPAAEPDAARRRVTLVRWFTDACADCAFSVPAIEQLQRAYAGAGLQTVAVYHPKPAGPVSPASARQFAEALGYSGPLAMDPQWEVLKKLYLDHHPDGNTSISLLLDRAGLVQYFHPGPMIGPSDDPNHAEANDDYRDLRRAIEVLLAE